MKEVYNKRRIVVNEYTYDVDKAYRNLKESMLGTKCQVDLGVYEGLTIIDLTYDKRLVHLINDLVDTEVDILRKEHRVYIESVLAEIDMVL